MTEDQFTHLITRLEDLAQHHPVEYKLRVALVAMLGYAYMVLVLLLLAALIFLMMGLMPMRRSGDPAVYLAIKIGVVVFFLATVLMRAMWVKIPTPNGLKLTREQTPRLFHLVDELSKKLQTPRIHHILIDIEYNAAMAQVPKFGPIGWSTNYLILGLPLLQVLSPEQLRAVIAHELGHLSGNHGRFSRWIYHSRQTWGRLLNQLKSNQDQLTTAIFEAFLKWYGPFFNAYTFVLARTQEYEADQAAAEFAGISYAAEALIETDIKATFLTEVYWPSVFQKAETEPEPVAGVYAEIPRVLYHDGIDPALVTKVLKQALGAETSYDDTHPSLRERLQAIRFLPRTADEISGWSETYQPKPFKQSAAEYFLAESLPWLLKAAETEWHESVKEEWAERHAFLTKARSELTRIETKVQTGVLTSDEILDRAFLTKILKGLESAVELFQEALKHFPDHPEANYQYGVALLEQGNAEGVRHLEKAMNQDIDAVMPGCRRIFEFYQDQNQPEEAERYRGRAQQHYEEMQLAQEERQSFTLSDELVPHTATSEQVRTLLHYLRGNPKIKAAYLAQKRVQHFPDYPYFVLGIVPDFPWYKLSRDSAQSELLQLVINQAPFPGEAYVILLVNDTRGFQKKFEKIDNSRIF